eukprot:TRINITY_DN34304_c0_g2_i1.p1 TRINITY_DN34304_c0_g2~~TRINITY_DN34304_c0_g2_i1.p1  ORF type:complete len:222 (-),score=26.47 TRINITY_DN34304_c0_g2_i1:76-741(-)
MMSVSQQQKQQSSSGKWDSFDHLFKVLLIGDTGVGKSSLLLRYTQDKFDELCQPTIGVDFKLKLMEKQNKLIKMTVWDTAGQERFRTLTSSYYRGAQGIIFVYDVTRRETFENMADVWVREVKTYSTIQSAVRMVVGNKIDKAEEREVSKEEGRAFAKQHGCLFLETSAKSDLAVAQAFEELKWVLKVNIQIMGMFPRRLINLVHTGIVQFGLVLISNSSC